MTPGTPRLASLDAFRGFTVAAMVVVNNPGSWRVVYPRFAMPTGMAGRRPT